MNRLLAWCVLALAAPSARASFLSGEALDTFADILALVVLFVVPIVVIVLFWIVHVLPEKIAHNRHHPQKDAITTLCLLSLVFGGLLWPIAWIWAYTKPVGYRMAYGTDKHEDFFTHMAERAEAGEVGERERRHLLDELDSIAARGGLSAEMLAARERIAAAPAAPPAAATKAQEAA